MRDFRDHGDRLFQPVRILGGPISRAIIQSAPDTGSVNDQFVVPKVTCRVRADSLINTGAIIQTHAGQKYLVCDHEENSVWRTHLLLRCDRQITWERPTTTTDPVTGLARDQSNTLVGNPWVYWERPTRPQTDYTTRIPDVDYVIVTGEQDIQRTDLINGHNILRLDYAMGVTVLGIRS